ncbi:MAG: hypothetical protein R2991_12905 [Thermoanaerobaculia bacterium]
MDSRLRQLVHDLRCAVSHALGDSQDVGRVLQTIRQQGWSLYLVVDRKREGAPVETYEVESTQPAAPEAREVAFRIDGDDLSFLRSIGIDPTRKVRNRRSTA